MLSGVRTGASANAAIAALAALAAVVALMLAAKPAAADDDAQARAALDRVRADPKLASDPEAIADLVRRADTFPPGAVRIDAWFLAANAYSGRLDRPAEAVPLWRKIIGDAQVDAVTAAFATKSLVAYDLARGDFAGAEDAIALAGPGVDPALRRRVQRAERRRGIHLGALGTLAIAIVLCGVAIARAAFRRQASVLAARVRASGRFMVGGAAYLALGGAALASGYEEGTARPFLFFGVGLLPLLLLARTWGAAGGASTRARLGRASICAASALAVAFLVLEHIDLAYLESLGL